MGCIISSLQKSEVINDTDCNIKVRYKPYRTCSLSQWDSPRGILGSCHFQYSTPEATIHITKESTGSISNRSVTFDVLSHDHCICTGIILRPGEKWIVEQHMIDDYIRTIDIDQKVVDELAREIWVRKGSKLGDSTHTKENDREARYQLQKDNFFYS